ncbi:pentapeptide repeat-containing protein [Microcoleus sp. CAWBG52]|uniref:pentapeptide repeat-containing protein n=1 Tax=Microcoleus sp. CAWBG52 TaxID=2841649 RepID=UPI0025D210FC|nr:pentapeptide repeat-containing protein [Microcoleus sp. CAWBG52]
MTVPVAGAVAVAVAVAVVALGIYVAWRALAGDEKQALIRTVAIVFAATGGTSFRNADLTDANFTEATLKSTDFRTANLTRTCFRNTEKLDRARVGKSILADTRIRELLVTGNGYKKSYVGANLQGANLTGVNLNEANLKQANLNEATLYLANVEFANLTETQALATDFTAASFTGACLEAWNIDGNTKLDRVDCRFVYLLEYPKPGTDDRERRPSSGEFASGEFTKLFDEVLNTIDLIFRNGIDWKAFVAAFKKVQVENEGTELTIQSIENKGDGVIVVKVNVPPDTNKEDIHRSFTQSYELMAARLEDKDKQITFLEGIVTQLSAKPVTIEVKATAENKIGSDNIDQSRKVEISGGTVNATGAGSLSLGDIDGTTANTIQNLPDSADRPS